MKIDESEERRSAGKEGEINRDERVEAEKKRPAGLCADHISNVVIT